MKKQSRRDLLALFHKAERDWRRRIRLFGNNRSRRLVDYLTVIVPLGMWVPVQQAVKRLASSGFTD